MEKPYKKMNIGCGEDIMPNYINIDYYNFKGVDVVHDLNSKEELPFPDAFFEEVIGYDIFEHVNVSIAIDKIKKKMTTIKPNFFTIYLQNFLSQLNF